MRYQHKWDDIDPSEVPAEGQANIEAIIHRALELGINHIETARGYGSSASSSLPPARCSLASCCPSCRATS